MMLVTDRTEWKRLVQGKSPYWQPTWAELSGFDSGLLVGDGVMAPVVLRRSNNGELHVASPGGDVGVAPLPDDDDLLKPKRKPRPGRFVEALAAIGASTAFLKEDPFDGEFDADMPTVDLAGSVEFDVKKFDPNVLPKNFRRTLTKLSSYPAEIIVNDFERIAEPFCRAHCATVENGLTADKFMKIVECEEWRTVVVVVWAEDGSFAAGDVLLIGHHGCVGALSKAVNPYGATAEEYRKDSPAVLSMVTTFLAARRCGAERLNVGGGIEAGDQLEWWKLRFGGRLIPQRAVRLNVVDRIVDAGDGVFPEWLGAA